MTRRIRTSPDLSRSANPEGLGIECITRDPREPAAQKYLDVCTGKAWTTATSRFCPPEECGGHPVCRPCYVLGVADGLIV